CPTRRSSDLLVATALFARRVARLTSVTREALPDAEGRQVYVGRGEQFFASSIALADRFDYTGDPDEVVFDLSAAHVWDASTVATLDAVRTRYAARGKSVVVIGMNDDSAARHARAAAVLGAGH